MTMLCEHLTVHREWLSYTTVASHCDRLMSCSVVERSEICRRQYVVSLVLSTQARRQKYNTCGTEIVHRTALFWVVTQRSVVISYRRFGTTYRSYLQGSRIQKKACSKPRNVGNKLQLIAA